MLNINFLRKIKGYDFLISFGIIMSMVYPGALGLFLFEKEWLNKANSLVALAIAFSTGSVTFLSTIVTTIFRLRKMIEDSISEFNPIRPILVITIAFQLISFWFYLPIAFTGIMYIRLHSDPGSIDSSGELDFVAFIMGLQIANIISVLLITRVIKFSSSKSKNEPSYNSDGADNPDEQ